MNQGPSFGRMVFFILFYSHCLFHLTLRPSPVGAIIPFSCDSRRARLMVASLISGQALRISDLVKGAILPSTKRLIRTVFFQFFVVDKQFTKRRFRTYCCSYLFTTCLSLLSISCIVRKFCPKGNRLS